MKRLLTALCVLLFACTNVVASSLPKKSDRAFVVDMACKEEKVCVLSKEARASWTEHATDLQTRTGVQAVLIVVHGTGNLSFEQYANDAANALTVGTRGNGGVVFLFDNSARKARLEVSRDLGGIIPDATAKTISELFRNTLEQSTASKESDPFGKSLSTVFDSVDQLATQQHMQVGGKAFVPEKDKSFTYFAITCCIIIFVCSLIAVLWYNERWYYLKGSVLGGAVCTATTLFFPTLAVSSLLTFIVAFVVTYIFAWIWHRAGDSAGWDIVDSVPTGGVPRQTNSMASGVADFAGGGATETVSTALQDVSNIAHSVGDACNPSACDLGGCDVSGCDIAGCDL